MYAHFLKVFLHLKHYHIFATLQKQTSALQYLLGFDALKRLKVGNISYFPLWNQNLLLL